MTDIHAVVLSPLNILFPSLELLQVRGTKITNKILWLNLGNCVDLYQTLFQPPKAKRARFNALVKIWFRLHSNLIKTNKKGEKELYVRGLLSYKFMLGRPSLPGYYPIFSICVKIKGIFCIIASFL